MEGNVTWQTFRRDLGFTCLTLVVTWVGEDCHLLLYGGEAPHLGSVVLAIPRPSLTGQGTSSTSSVLNVTGHKDEALCRALAEQVCSALGKITICSGGVHLDGIQPRQIEALAQAVEELGKEVCRSALSK